MEPKNTLDIHSHHANIMKKILVISLYDGNNEIEEVDDEEIAEFSSNMEKCKKGDKVVWLGEEFMYVEL